VIGEINIYGFYIPWGCVMFFAAIGLAKLVSKGLARFGLYRYIWHPALFDFALVVIMMGLLFLVFSVRGF
jgi:hypothetical protein